uniref:Uncharacterized protein n=1 Tax=Oryza rufipogon TaxID=4529 RepID=A0A0E0P1E6_ORYRU
MKFSIQCVALEVGIAAAAASLPPSSPLRATLGLPSSPCILTLPLTHLSSSLGDDASGEGEGLSGDQRQRNHSIRVDGNPRHLEGLRSIWHNFATGEEDVLLQWPNNHLLYARSTHDLPTILCLRLQCCFFHESTASSFFSATCSGQHLNSSSIFDPHVMAGFELYSGFC